MVTKRGMNIKEELWALQDVSYADFQASLIPDIPRMLFIGGQSSGSQEACPQVCRECGSSGISGRFAA